MGGCNLQQFLLHFLGDFLRVVSLQFWEIVEQVYALGLVVRLVSGLSCEEDNKEEKRSRWDVKPGDSRVEAEIVMSDASAEVD